MRRILIVDDDAAACRTLGLHLGALGYEVRAGHTLEEGLAAARADAPDLIILDVRMPGRSGLEGLPDLRREFPGAAVIVVTAYHDRETSQRAVQGGALACLAKPLDINELESALGQAERNQPADRRDETDRSK